MGVLPQRAKQSRIFYSIAVLSVIDRDSAKLPWECPLLIHSTASAKFMFSTATSLDSVCKLCDIKYFKKKGDFHNICERINENLTKCSIKMRATDGSLKRVKDTVFVYVPSGVAYKRTHTHLHKKQKNFKFSVWIIRCRT